MEGLVIIETDVNRETMVVWSYPGITGTPLEAALTAQAEVVCGPAAVEAAKQPGRKPSTAYFTKHGATWAYGYALAVGPAPLPKVQGFAVVVLTSTFQPEQYGALAQLLAKQYFSSGEPTSLLETYLAAFTVGEAGGSWRASAYDPKRALLDNSSLLGVVRLFGQEILKLWTAVLLKKRVVVYCPVLQDLLRLMRSIPQLAWHRHDWGVLRPWITGSKAELEDLASSGVYIVGMTDASLKSKSDLYDVFVDVPERSITVSDHAKAYFETVTPHRDIGAVVTACASDAAATDESTIKAIAVKTGELLAKLRSLEQPISRAFLEDPGLRLAPAMQRFIYGVATADPTLSAV